MNTMKIYVVGEVGRQVIVEGKTTAECEINAKKEWAALTGGDVATSKAKLSVVIEKI